MSDMHFREPNQVKWQGSRPGHNGTQVSETGTANTATVDLYTVPAGLVFHFCGWVFLSWGVGFGDGAHLWIWTTVALDRREINRGVHAANDGFTVVKSYWPPLEVPTGAIIRLISDNVNSVCFASIHGWVE